ncbi:DNA-binding XRE family transcriptional regulator [Bradyrhizobium sp. LB1.3]
MLCTWKLVHLWLGMCVGFGLAAAFRKRTWPYQAGVDRSYLVSLERQSKNPTIDLLERIAEALEVHLSEFFVRPVTPKTFPKDRNR